mmetsp:Transcript_26632/g.57975  ORF Transcript_26632/g.57975 Transcript_26632/m.57975 type:complete len:216 (+) Transcript_26632:269-916(+)
MLRVRSQTLCNTPCQVHIAGLVGHCHLLLELFLLAHVRRNTRHLERPPQLLHLLLLLECAVVQHLPLALLLVVEGGLLLVDWPLPFLGGGLLLQEEGFVVVVLLARQRGRVVVLHVLLEEVLLLPFGEHLRIELLDFVGPEDELGPLVPEVRLADDAVGAELLRHRPQLLALALLALLLLALLLLALLLSLVLLFPLCAAVTLTSRASRAAGFTI